MKYHAVVTHVVQEAPRVWTIFFTVDDATYSFVAGQYISVYFEETGLKTGKAYSLSSAPGDDTFSITVKKIGEFSSLLCALQPGDTFEVSPPFGFFNSNDDAPIVAIASGVGISPIWSIIRDQLANKPTREVALFLTAPHQQELIFRTRIDTLFAHCAHAAARYFVTRDESDIATCRRFVVEVDVPAALLPTGRFYVCGSEVFVRAMWLQLMEAGVDESRVVTETFFESRI